MGDQYINDFAKRLYSLRKSRGQSARNMSLSIGQSHNYINGLENGRNYPTMRSFFYICEYLGITPAEFFDYTNKNQGKTTELYSEIRKLDAQSQEYFLRLVQDVNNRPK